MKSLGIITARSGSKGLVDKNIKELAGKPLLAYSIEAAKKSQCFSEIMVSTDSQKYADIAKNCGANVPFLRSEEMANDTADSWDVVKEVLGKYLQIGKKFDTICLLQPTSPLRTEKDIIQGYKLLVEKEADAVTGVCEVEHSPLWTMILEEDLSMKEYRKRALNYGPRQSLPTYYRVNGALYIRKVEYKAEGIVLLEANEYAYKMDRSKSIDIDTIDDFYLAEFIMDKGKKNKLIAHE